MNLQKRLDLNEQYRNSIEFLSKRNRETEYTVIPEPPIKPGLVKAEVSHEATERTKR